MPRWDKHAAQGYGASKSCRACGATEDVLPLTVYRGDGNLYCTPCVEAWQQQSPGGSKPSKAVKSREGGTRQGGAKESRLAADALSPSCNEGGQSIEQTGSKSSAPHIISSAAETGTDDVVEAVAGNSSAAGDSAGVEAEASAFAREVARLQACYVAERSAEAEEEQRGEIETLQEIYDGALQQMSSEPHVIRLELATDMEGVGSVEIVVSTPGGEVVAGVVEALPPLVMCCALPARYPQDDMPVFSLEAAHLASDVLGKLREDLEGLAAENTGQQLLFMWASALQDRAPPSSRLVLEAADEEEGLAANMETALQLLAHDRAMREERRQREMQRCPVCMEDVLGSRGLFLRCEHFACRECLQQMAQIYTGEADLSSLRCPSVGCNQPLGIDILRSLLGADSPVLARWEELSLQKCFDTMKDVTFCPRCDSSGDHVPCIEDEDRMAKCEVCGFVFCGKCRSVFHPGAPCADKNDEMWALEQRARGQGRSAEIAQAELLTIRHLQKSTRNCPSCSSTIEKTEGCNKMKCRTCGTYFCWKCSKEITGYDHFASSECRLFDDDEIKRWNQQMNGMGHNGMNRAQARANEAQFLAQFHDQTNMGDNCRSCPRCRNLVPREGKNNQMRCFACQTPFCARCASVLPNKKPGEHFGAKGMCPQHSD